MLCIVRPLNFASDIKQAQIQAMKDKLYDYFRKGRGWENYFQELKINHFREEV